METPEIIVSNLETNITAIIKELVALKEAVVSSTPEGNQKLIDAINSIEKPDDKNVLASLRSVTDAIKSIKIKYPDVSFTDEAETIVKAIKSIKIPAPMKMDMSEHSNLLKEILTQLKVEDKEPENYPLPEEQVKKLTPDNTDIVDAVKKVIKAVENIKPNGGGGGVDIVGLKSAPNAFGIGTPINPATDDTLKSVIETNVHTNLKEVVVASKGHVCVDNTSSTPLGINGIFTGNWQDTLDYSEIIVTVFTNQPSLTDGLIVQWSSNAIDVHGDDVFTISATSGKTFSFPCQNRYVRVIYKNDGVAQTQFSLETLLKRFASKGSSHRLKDSLVQEDDAIVTKGLIAGKTTAGGGAIVDVKVNPSGALTVEATVPSLTDGTTIAKSYLIDEHGVQSQMLTDTMFAGAPVVIDSAHHEIHCGDMFVTTRAVDLSNGASDVLLVVVPNEVGVKKYHFQLSVDVESESHLEIYEAPTTSNNGTVLNNINRERNSGLTSGLSINYTPTSSADGSLLYVKHLGSGKTTGGGDRTSEFVLKNNTKYLIRCTNSTTSNNYISWEINHYIHPGI